MLGSGTSLGVDIGSKELKIVLLRKTGRRYQVEQAARVPLPDGGDTGDIAIALQQFLTESHAPTGHIVFSLPTHACSVKFARVPHARPAETARVIHFEAESQIPLPLNELAWGYRVADDPASGMTHAVIAAARKDLIEERLMVLDDAGLHPSLLLVSALAGITAATTSFRGKPLLVLDIGSDWTDLSVVDGGHIYASRSIKLGANDIDRGDESAMTRWLARLEREIRLSVESLTGDDICERPRRAMLIGDLADLPGIEDALRRQVSLPIEMGNPWIDMTISHGVQGKAPVFATATGLALAAFEPKQTIDLMPKNVAIARERRQKQTLAFAGLTLAIVLLIVVNMLLRLPLVYKTIVLHDLQERVRLAAKDSTKEGPNYSAIATQVGSLSERLGKVEHDPLEILRRCSETMPKAIGLTEFAFQDGKTVVLKGRARSNTDVASAVGSLTEMGIFERTLLDYSNLASADGLQGYDFQITCTLPTEKGTKLSKKTRKTSAEGQTGMTVQ